MSTLKQNLNVNIFSLKYWSEATKEFSNLRSMVFAAIVLALRIAVKFFKIPLLAGLSLSFDCYVNSLGSFVYGPVVGLAVGAVSDTLGCLLIPSGPYFFPFIFVEMSSSFIFGLFLWRRNISTARVLTSKFTVNFICNIIMTSLFVKWQYFLLGDTKFATYNIINGVRIGKNLVLFPIEACLIIILISALIPALKALRAIPQEQTALKFKAKDIVILSVFFVLSVALVLAYAFFLKDFISAHNLKLF